MKTLWLTLLAAFLLTGCATEKIDWPARVGNYTYDQAVMDYGPPDKSAKLSDGTTVADWVTQHGGVIAAPEPYFLPPGCYFGPLTPMYSETYVPTRYLRLTFSPDGKLKTWRKFAR